MNQYMLQVAYTAESWAILTRNPQDRIGMVSKVVENLGGKVVGGWLSFGDYDSVLIVELPTRVDAAALAMAFAAGGACRSVKTTPLLTTDQGLKALKKAGKTGYAPPQAGKKK